MSEYFKVINYINKRIKSVLSSCLYSYLFIMTRRPHFRGLAHPKTPFHLSPRVGRPTLGRMDLGKRPGEASRARNLGIPSEYSECVLGEKAMCLGPQTHNNVGRGTTGGGPAQGSLSLRTEFTTVK